MTNRSILLVEDNPDDEALTLRALKRNNILKEVTQARQAPSRRRDDLEAVLL
jgi:two-component system, response regulator